MSRKYTPEQDEWIISEAYNGCLFADIASRFNETFGQNRTTVGISIRARSLGSPRRVLTFTDEMDRWIVDNANQYTSYAKLSVMFNEKFGTDKTPMSLAQHANKLFVRTRYFTEDQKRWIIDHFYLPTSDMVRMFNRTFGTNRSLRSMRNQRQRLHAHRNKRRSHCDME